jgi:uncharacterized protein YdeI (YjbR/CyaY-like superfamily)
MRFRATVELNGKTRERDRSPGRGGRRAGPRSAPAGDQVEVDPEFDAAPRGVEVPADLAAALAQDDVARASFESMPSRHRKEWVRWVTEAKKPDARATRIAKTVQSLHDGKRTR